jgi:hypothetical protein
MMNEFPPKYLEVIMRAVPYRIIGPCRIGIAAILPADARITHK